MSSEKKKRKVSKKLHWGRGKQLDHKGKGIKGYHFFTSSQRRENNKIDTTEIEEEKEEDNDLHCI